MSRTATAKTERMSATANSLPVLVEQKSTNSILNEAMRKRGMEMDTSWFARARRRKMAMLEKGQINPNAVITNAADGSTTKGPHQSAFGA